jgi:hypothetical protein
MRRTWFSTQDMSLVAALTAGLVAAEPDIEKHP